MTPQRRKPTKPAPRSGCVIIAILLLIIGTALLAYQRLDRSDDSNTIINATGLKVWQGPEQMNLLLLGLDCREQENGVCRTDTIILTSINTVQKQVAMLSIPRDLWVPIPGYGENRINTAYFYGELNQTGYGAVLAKRTIQLNFGMPIDYYAVVNFEGFRQVVDALDGIDIEVAHPIHDTQYPNGNYGTKTIYIPAGLQRMDGETALQYVRTRHESDDFVRAGRQQQVLMAMRERALSVDAISKIPRLVSVLSNNFETDLPLDKMVQLAQIGAEIEPISITHKVVDHTMAGPFVTARGENVLLPDWEAILQTVDQLFPEQARCDFPDDGATIFVQNGTTYSGLAQQVASSLRLCGANVINYGNAARSDYAESVIVYYGNREDSVDSLAGWLGVKDDNISRQTAPANVDIVLTVGEDFYGP